MAKTPFLSPVKELSHLWEPVYPHLARHLGELYGRGDGRVAEIGPFCGSIFSLRKEGVGDHFLLAPFPGEMAQFFRDQVSLRGLSGVMPVVGTDASLGAVRRESLDLVVFRGALFFPRLFRIDFPALFRVLKRGGVALAGGGFGKYTPADVIREMGGRSRDLNLQAGKTEVTAEALRSAVAGGLAPGRAEVITEGGLWVVIRKE